MSITESLNTISNGIPEHVKLVAVSKTRSNEEILEVYNAGHRDFGENRVQELVAKAEELPKDIRWHLIGHLQTNKVKYIAPFVHLIHSIESKKVLIETNKRAAENDRVIDILLQFHIAIEESKFGFSLKEIEALVSDGIFSELKNIRVKGVMGMATFTNETKQIKKEFRTLKSIFDHLKVHLGEDLDTISMGMSGDYSIAIEEGSNLIRVGSKIFGDRNY